MVLRHARSKRVCVDSALFICRLTTPMHLQMHMRLKSSHCFWLIVRAAIAKITFHQMISSH